MGKMLEQIVSSAPVFLLVAARCFTMIMTTPLFSSRTVPRIAKLALVFYMSFLLFPHVTISAGTFAFYSKFISMDGSFSLEYVLLLLGEGLIGVILGFFIQIIFASFSTAGQFFAFQMGFSASEVYDSLSQVENPLMGQFLNFMAMLVFLQNGWLNRLFSSALVTSFQTLNVFSIIDHSEFIGRFMAKGISLLFADAFLIALPIMGSLFLINVTVGILTKAAPQMNLLSEGFPILMLTSFYLIIILIPYYMEMFNSTFKEAFRILFKTFSSIRGGGI